MASEAVAGAVAGSMMDPVTHILDKVFDDAGRYTVDNNREWCILNDWAARDQFARAHGTYGHRWSYPNTIIGIPDGRMYCAEVHALVLL